MPLKLKTAPAAEPVSLSEAKAYCRVTSTDDDTDITRFIKAAREQVEIHTQRALITQTWQLYLDDFPACDEIELPLAPLQSVSSVKYYDSDGVLQTLSTDDYSVDTVSEPGKVVLNWGESWPVPDSRPNAVVVEYVCGYGAAGSAVPAMLLQGVLYRVNELYQNRESVALGLSVADVPGTFQAIVGPFRVYS